MANVLLIYPRPEEIKERRFGFSLNLLYVAAILKQAGHRVIQYLDYSLEPFDLARLRERVDEADVAIVEFDSFPLKRAINIDHGEYLVQQIRGCSDKIKIIAFGCDLILFPRELKAADYTFTVEPERGILAVFEYLFQGRMKEDIPRGVVADLDELPFPERGLLSPFVEHGGSLDHKPHLARSTLIQTSRGCLNRCSFCQRRGWSQGFRPHSVDYVIREFRELQRNHYVNVWITDDNFTFDLKRAGQILETIYRREITVNMKLALSSWAHIDREFLESAKRANVSIISFGVESANPEILEFYKKKIDLEKFKELVSFAGDIGLFTIGNFIIGAPMETEETIHRTFRYALDTPFDQVNIKKLDYMAGSELYQTLPLDMRAGKRHIFACKENGLNNFPLQDLKSRIDQFQETFKRLRGGRFRQKAGEWGLPYEVAQ
jgi:radical SAM superfamily enzyme YgiQ (UPF0313 family)